MRQARVAACIHAYQCLLCGYTARVPTVFVFLLQQSDMLIWKGDAGIIDAGAGCGHVKCKLNTACLPDTNGYLQSLKGSDPLQHISDVKAVFVSRLLWSFAASGSDPKGSLSPTTSYCGSFLHYRMFSI